VSHVSRLLLAMLSTFVLAGILEPHLPLPGQPFNEIGLVESLAFALLVFAWCKADAAAHNVPLPGGARLFAALFPPIGVPYYFFRTRPWRSALADTGKAVTFIVVAFAIQWGCFYVSARVP